MEMGTGKTKTTIDNIGYLNLKKQLKAALIIAPKSVYSVWKKELNVHLPSMSKYSCHLWKQTTKKELKTFDKFDGLKFFMINVEALSTKNGLRACEENNFRYTKKEKVEPMTLKAFVREQVEKGKELPFDLFGVYIANKAKLTTKE